MRNHSDLVSYAGVIGGALTLLAVMLRVAARLPCCGGTWGWDDWAIVVTMVGLRGQLITQKSAIY